MALNITSYPAAPRGQRGCMEWQETGLRHSHQKGDCIHLGKSSWPNCPVQSEIPAFWRKKKKKKSIKRKILSDVHVLLAQNNLDWILLLYFGRFGWALPVIWMWLGFLCLCFWQMWSVFNPDCIFVLAICLILNVRSTTGLVVIAIQLFWTQLSAADRRGCTGCVKMSFELSLLPRVKPKSSCENNKKYDSPIFFFITLFSPMLCLLGYVEIRKKKKRKSSKGWACKSFPSHWNT